MAICDSWDPEITYDLRDLVGWNGMTYISLAEDNLNNEPSADDETYWAVREPVSSPTECGLGTYEFIDQNDVLQTVTHWNDITNAKYIIKFAPYPITEDNIDAYLTIKARIWGIIQEYIPMGKNWMLPPTSTDPNNPCADTRITSQGDKCFCEHLRRSYFGYEEFLILKFRELVEKCQQ